MGLRVRVRVCGIGFRVRVTMRGESWLTSGRESWESHVEGFRLGLGFVV